MVFGLNLVFWWSEGYRRRPKREYSVNARHGCSLRPCGRERAPLAIHVKPLRGSHGSRTGPRPTHTASVRTLKGYHLSGVGGTRPRCRRHIAFCFKWAVSWYPGRDPWETLKGFTWIASGVPWVSVVFWWSEILHPHVETGD